jgi:hypothetical protein
MRITSDSKSTKMAHMPISSSPQNYKKGGLNGTTNLVEKYGKCQEVVGRGAFGIVRISHKLDPANSNNELLYIGVHQKCFPALVLARS